ncbi:Inner membrane protein YibH [compost metagenome]
MSFSGSPPAGRVPVVIEITDPDYARYAALMPGGSYGQAALYSEHFHHVAVMRKILLRMAAWMNYIFPFH